MTEPPTVTACADVTTTGVAVMVSMELTKLTEPGSTVVAGSTVVGGMTCVFCWVETTVIGSTVAPLEESYDNSHCVTGTIFLPPEAVALEDAGSDARLMGSWPSPKVLCR